MSKEEFLLHLETFVEGFQIPLPKQRQKAKYPWGKRERKHLKNDLVRHARMRRKKINGSFLPPSVTQRLPLTTVPVPVWEAGGRLIFTTSVDGRGRERNKGRRWKLIFILISLPAEGWWWFFETGPYFVA